MKKAIEKMIAEYEEKISDEDIRLTAVCDKIIRLRKEFAMSHMADLVEKKDIIKTRRQAYVQAQLDFNSLLDHIERR